MEYWMMGQVRWFSGGRRRLITQVPTPGRHRALYPDGGMGHNKKWCCFFCTSVWNFIQITNSIRGRRRRTNSVSGSPGDDLTLMMIDESSTSSAAAHMPWNNLRPKSSFAQAVAVCLIKGSKVWMVVFFLVLSVWVDQKLIQQQIT